MQHVYTARDEMDATFVQGLLRQDGIESIVQGQALGSAWGTLPLSDESLPSVWVEETDVERARPIIETYRRTDQANAENATAEESRATWSCPNCGERVEDQFTQCWKCGHQRPASPVAEA
jgi:rubrerythrin